MRQTSSRIARTGSQHHRVGLRPGLARLQGGGWLGRDMLGADLGEKVVWEAEAGRKAGEQLERELVAVLLELLGGGLVPRAVLLGGPLALHAHKAQLDAFLAVG